ncbi:MULTISPECIES: hypothetical protein [Flavobacteriaceae]|uniref:hypothetical protein n=1 Tax=Flavobacteriaceae TaxID=49546 RepID=UPI00149194BC|nr:MULTISPECIES: hypothetical protein [Allomuricauda]MDC6366615.1 hypothetical protein [Muricauda sp. AC10]
MKCDFKEHCTKVPFPDECFDYCTQAVVRIATRDEKELILKLDKTLIQKIEGIYDSIPVESFEDLEAGMNQSELDSLRAAFSNLTQARLDFFNKSKSEREFMMFQIKKGFIDPDNLDNLAKG